MTSHPLHFLLADDDRDDKELFASVLSQIIPDAHIHMVSDGKDVVRYLENCAPHELPTALILDVNMPQMGGLAVLDWLKTNPRFLLQKNFVLSTSAEQWNRQVCLDRGVVEYFIKPNTVQGIWDIATKIADYLLTLHGFPVKRKNNDPGKTS